MAERKYSPSFKERSARRSSTRTESEVMATAQPRGLLQQKMEDKCGVIVTEGMKHTLRRYSHARPV